MCNLVSKKEEKVDQNNRLTGRNSNIVKNANKNEINRSESDRPTGRNNPKFQEKAGE